MNWIVAILNVSQQHWLHFPHFPYCQHSQMKISPFLNFIRLNLSYLEWNISAFQILMGSRDEMSSIFMALLNIASCKDILVLSVISWKSQIINFSFNMATTKNELMNISLGVQLLFKFFHIIFQQIVCFNFLNIRENHNSHT